MDMFKLKYIYLPCTFSENYFSLFIIKQDTQNSILSKKKKKLKEREREKGCRNQGVTHKCGRESSQNNSEENPKCTAVQQA